MHVLLMTVSYFQQKRACEIGYVKLPLGKKECVNLCMHGVMDSFPIQDSCLKPSASILDFISTTTRFRIQRLLQVNERMMFL